MARTNDALVEAIIDVESGRDLTPFINIANIMVTQCCTGLDDEYPSATLTEIETWLAAHFYTNLDGRAFQEKAGSVSERKQSKVDLGLSTSHYGQTAMTLDYQGGLARINQNIIKGRAGTVGVFYLGMSRDEFDDYIAELT